VRGFLVAFAAALIGLSAFAWLAPRPSPPAPDIAAMASAWDGAIAFDAGFDALDPHLGPDIAGEGHAFDAADAWFGLPRSEGHEEVAGLCGACHSLRLVMATRASPARWEALIVAMREKHGMADLPETEHRLVHAYLAREFALDAQSPPKP
jgi:hypothetical protein